MSPGPATPHCRQRRTLKTMATVDLAPMSRGRKDHGISSRSGSDINLGANNKRNSARFPSRRAGVAAYEGLHYGPDSTLLSAYH